MKRFWQDVSVDAGRGVRLDGKPVNTPGRLPLVLPTDALAADVTAPLDVRIEAVRGYIRLSQVTGGGEASWADVAEATFAPARPISEADLISGP